MVMQLVPIILIVLFAHVSPVSNAITATISSAPFILNVLQYVPAFVSIVILFRYFLLGAISM
jgi:hypothetical protein